MLTASVVTVVEAEWPRRRRRDDGQRVADPRHDGQQPGRGRRDHERGPTDDQREAEEERAVDPAGQQHEQCRERHRDRAFEDVLGGPERVAREQVVDDEHEQAGQREEGEDRRLRLRPEAGHRDHHGHREQEAPGDDPHDPVVCLRRHTVGGHLPWAADHGRVLRRLTLALAVTRPPLAAERARTTEQPRHDECGHHDEIRDRGREGDDEDRISRHVGSQQDRARCRSGGPRAVQVRGSWYPFGNARSASRRVQAVPGGTGTTRSSRPSASPTGRSA